MGLILYNENVGTLSERDFLMNIPHQTKVMEVKDPGVVKREIGKVMGLVSHLAGMVGEITEPNKADIKDLILMRYKELSLDEIYYAFKLERYGVLTPKTEHYQLLDASYVSSVLSKYKKWKMDSRKKYNLIKKQDESKKKFTESEQERMMLDAVDRAKDEIREHGAFQYSRHHVYDWLIQTGRMEQPTDQEKIAAHKIAIRKEVAELESKALHDRLLRKRLKADKEAVERGNTITKNRAKSMLLEEIFKTQVRNERQGEDIEDPD